MVVTAKITIHTFDTLSDC